MKIWGVPVGVLLVALLALLAVPAMASAGTWTVEKLTNDLADERTPRLGGDYVVWAKYDGSDFEIWVRNLGFLAVYPITDDSVEELEPYTDGRYVVYQRVVPHPGGGLNRTDTDIYLYDIEGGATTQLSNGTNTDVNARVSGDWVVWSSKPQDDSRGSSIWAYRISTGGPARQIADDTVNNGFAFLDLNNHFAVWDAQPVGTGGGAQAVWLCDLRGPDLKVISVEDGIVGRPCVSGSWAVWSQIPAVGNSMDVYLHTIATGTTVKLTDGTKWEQLYGDPSLDGGRLIWYHDGVYPNRDILVQNTVGGQRTTLASLPGVFNPLMGQDIAAWSTNFLSPTADIYAYSFVTGKIARLADNGFQDSYLTVSGNRAVWLGKRPDGNTDLYLATYDPSPDPPQTFRDVPPETYPYYDSIQTLADLAIVGGYDVEGGKEFRPDNTVLRAQFAKMIDGILEVPVTEDLVCRFVDLGQDKLDDLYPHDYVEAAARNGVTQGVTPTTFEPWTPISRIQVITMVIRACKVRDWDTTVLVAPPPDWAGSFPSFQSDVHKLNLRIAEFNGLLVNLVGFGADWDPWGPATRAECAQIMWNLLKKTFLF